jgi:hypothetical protein
MGTLFNASAGDYDSLYEEAAGRAILAAEKEEVERTKFRHGLPARA